MIKIVDKGKNQANLKAVEESVVTSLHAFDGSHYILASTDDVNVLVSALRKFDGKTGQHIANKSGIKQETISAYENGKRIMSLSALNALVSALGYKCSICIEQIESEDTFKVDSLQLIPDEIAYNFVEKLKKP
jgi:DNA-binding XRE family transcriptional regulator